MKFLKPKVKFLDRVEFCYDSDTPLVYDSGKCDELVRQIRGVPHDMPVVSDLVFKEAYVDVMWTSLLVSVHTLFCCFFNSGEIQAFDRIRLPCSI